MGTPKTPSSPVPVAPAPAPILPPKQSQSAAQVTNPFSTSRRKPSRYLGPTLDETNSAALSTKTLLGAGYL